MTHTIIIETQNDTDFALIKSLAQRLGLSTNEHHTGSDKSKSAEEMLFRGLFGSWQGTESGDELAELIQLSRQDKPRDIDL